MKKKILFILSSKDFRDEEYLIPRDFLESNGFEIVVASDKTGIAIGVYGNDVEIDLLGEDVDVSDFMAIVFVGGAGAIKFLDNAVFYRIINEAKERGILLAAICIAPLILANAGVLNGLKATVWSSKDDKRAVKEIKDKGIFYKEEGVVLDDNIITASGPNQAKLFAKAILEKLT